LIVPGRLTLLAAICLAMALVAAAVQPSLVLVILAADLVLIANCLILGWRIKLSAISVEREEGGKVQVGRAEEFVYRIANRSRSNLVLRLRQPWPEGIEAESDELELRIGGGEIVRASLTATPHVRGTTLIPPVQIDLRTNSDWSRRRMTAAGEMELTVFPSLAGLKEFETLRRHHATGIAGVHRQRMLGSGREFDQLREYSVDDDYRDINWKATARRRQPMTNLYQAERSQNVLLCLDCSRMMGNPVGSGTALDRAVDASIMLAHVANRSADRVGLVLFRDVVHRFIKPTTGMAATERIIDELVSAQPKGVFPSYAALASALRAHQNMRSMVFLFTDLNDPQLATNLTEVLPLVSRRHVVVVISLRDPLLERVADGPANDRRGMYQVLAARQLASERATRTRELRQIGASVLEADADSLTIKVLNTYLSLKARQVV
jgi:uncharacterized protein (DUF58 family)